MLEQEKKKYIKQMMLPEIGLEGQLKLKNAKVAIVGCGGLGCPTLLYLAASGIGTLGIIDFDIVSLSNLHRQILFGIQDVGKKKINVAQEKINTLHPETKIILHPVMINEDNANAILNQYDVVIDGSDNFLTRYVVNDVCVKLNKTLVYGSILGFEGQLTVLNFKGSRNLRDIFPEPPDAADVPDCSENGVLATVPGIIGTMMANECIKVILEKQVLQNKLQILNCMSMTSTLLDY
jgi:molybdopterin-synthase adenylyltransferase